MNNNQENKLVSNGSKFSYISPQISKLKLLKNYFSSGKFSSENHSSSRIFRSNLNSNSNSNSSDLNYHKKNHNESHFTTLHFSKNSSYKNINIYKTISKT